MVAPGSYTEVTVLGISHTLQAAGEFVNLTSTAPAGITVSFTPASPVPVPATKSVNVTMLVQASPSTAPGNYSVTITADSGANMPTQSFNVRVVQNRIVILRNSMVPSDFNITAGGTIYWQNLDGPAGGCGSTGGTGLHNLVFTTLAAANSSTIKQFGVYSYTFMTPGSYFYYSSLDSDHLVNGTINVLSPNGGGMGMVSRMPAFSYFKQSSVAALAPTPAANATASEQTSSERASPAPALGLGLASLVALGFGFSTLSGQGLEAGLAFLVGFVALALAPTVSTRGKRRTAAMGGVAGAWTSGSDAR